MIYESLIEFYCKPNCQVTKLPGYQIVKLPNFQVTKLPGYQIVKSPNCWLQIWQVTKLSGYQIISNQKFAHHEGYPLPIDKCHSDDDIFKLEIVRSPNDHQWFKPLQEWRLNTPCISSSWFCKVSSFLQETCQSYNRNDPVK